MLYDLNNTPPGLPMQTVATAARLTNMSEVTIRRRIKDGTLPAYRIGRSIRISDDDLMRLYEPVNMKPTDSQERIQKLSEARERQAKYKVLRRGEKQAIRALKRAQNAMDEPEGKGEYPNRDRVTKDRIGDEVVARMAQAVNLD